MVLGQGFGPLAGFVSRWLVKIVLNQIDCITVRDEASFQALKQLGVTKPSMYLTVDPSACLRDFSPKDGQRILGLEGINQSSRPLLGVALRGLVGTKDRAVFNQIARAIDWLVKEYNYQPVFLLFQPPQDIEIVNYVSERLTSSAQIVFRKCRPKEMLALISQFDLLLGMRLHSLIFAALNQVPMLGLSYDPKVRAFMAAIEQPVVELERFDQLKEELKKIIENKKAIKATLKAKQNYLYNQAKFNFTCFEALMGHKDSRLLRKTRDFAGVLVDNVSVDEALDRVKEMVCTKKSHLIVTPNPEIIVAAQKDDDLKNIINSADLRLPDGISLVVASKLMRRPLRERVTGIDFMLRVLSWAATKNKKIFLLGSQPDIVNEAAANLIKKFPGLNIVGMQHGYFKNDAAVITIVRNARPDFLFVGLGAGWQEKWLARHLSELEVPVAMVIGGSLDVLSGRKKRAPQLIQKLWLEWLYRLAKEPQRLKRQLALPRFLRLILFKKS